MNLNGIENDPTNQGFESNAFDVIVLRYSFSLSPEVFWGALKCLGSVMVHLSDSKNQFLNTDIGHFRIVLHVTLSHTKS